MSSDTRASSIEAFLQSPLPDELVFDIAGNGPRHVKEIPVKWLTILHANENTFVSSIGRRVKIVEVSVTSNPDDPCAKDGKVVGEIDVTEDMLNTDGVLDNGCAVFLIDEGSILSITVLKEAEGRRSYVGVSQAINTVFHNPAKLGAKLRIVSTSMTLGEMMSSRCEIWDSGNHRLVASGVQLQMKPSKPYNPMLGQPLIADMGP